MKKVEWKCSMPCRAYTVAQNPEFTCMVQVKFDSNGRILTSVGDIVREVDAEIELYHHAIRCGYCGELVVKK